MRWWRLTLMLLVLVAVSPALAVQPDEILPDPVQEARARGLSKQLRCMVCQNQSIDDSDAPLARDLRVLVRERIKAGDSDRQVLDFLVQRYGEFVLLQPRLSSRTALLWTAAPLLLLGGGLVLFLMARRRSRSPHPQSAEAGPLTAEEEAQLARLTRLDDQKSVPGRDPSN